MKKTLVLLLALTALCGCEPCPHYNRLSVADLEIPDSRSRKPYGTVQMFYSADQVRRTYQPVAFMSCTGSTGEEGAILKAMLYRAADQGADGIILNPGQVREEAVNNNTQNISVRWGWMSLIGNSDQCAYRAQSIRFTSP